MLRHQGSRAALRLMHPVNGARAVRGAFRSVPGSQPFRRLLQTHALSTAADAFFAVSLAGSLFFNVSLDAARPRIVLALLLTMAPFAVVAPLVGPIIDRVRGGHRLVVAVSCIARALLAWVLASGLRSLLFYPEAFGILVLGKTYSVAKSTLVPRVMEDVDDLVSANSWLSRISAGAGAVGGGLAVAIMQLADAPAVLRAGALVYVLAGATAMTLPRPRPAPVTSRALEYEELHAPPLFAAAVATGTLRAMVGFTIFTLGFALKAAGQGAEFYALVVAASGIGTFSATFVAPRLRRRWPEHRMILWSLLAPAAVGLVATASFDRVTVLVLAATVGASASVGRQAFDAMVQARAPDADRGRAFARYETAFQLAWVVGALLPTLLRPAPWLGTLGAVIILGVAAFTAERLRRGDDGPGPGAELLGHVTSLLADAEEALSVRILQQARRLAAEGKHRQATLEAWLAVAVAIEQQLDLDPSRCSFWETDARENWLALQRRRLEALAATSEIDRDEADAALLDAARVLDAVEHQLQSGDRNGTGPAASEDAGSNGFVQPPVVEAPPVPEADAPGAASSTTQSSPESHARNVRSSASDAER
ncbi:MAG: MFS transporter [Actinomycetota bacterium]|nr:MFS transporter [Actinomycetota bacterium]